MRSSGPLHEHGHPAPFSPAPGPGPLRSTRIAGEGSGTATITRLILNDFENIWCEKVTARREPGPGLCLVELMLHDQRREPRERRLDLDAFLCGREEELGTVRLRELRHVPFLELGVRGQVRLVHDDEDR